MPKQFNIPDEIIGQVTKGDLPVSTYSDYLAPLHDKHVIGINNAYMLGHWLDALFFGDCGWYLVHRLALAEWPKLKITCCNRFANKPKEQSEGIKYLPKSSNYRFGICPDPRQVSWNSNSGAAAISLARHFGVKRIVLLGFDMNQEGPRTHWHKGHGSKKPPPFVRHLRGFSTIAQHAKEMGLEIINASPDSAIEDFPKVALKDVLS